MQEESFCLTNKLKREEAEQIILPLIDLKINFHKIEHMKVWESNHNIKNEFHDLEAKRLIKEKNKILYFIKNSNRKNIFLDIKIN